MTIWFHVTPFLCQYMHRICLLQWSYVYIEYYLIHGMVFRSLNLDSMASYDPHQPPLVPQSPQLQQNSPVIVSPVSSTFTSMNVEAQSSHEASFFVVSSEDEPIWNPFSRHKVPVDQNTLTEEYVKKESLKILHVCII